jgi:hypothetical protein
MLYTAAFGLMGMLPFCFDLVAAEALEKVLATVVAPVTPTLIPFS